MPRQIATPTAGSPIGEGGSVSVSTVFHPDLDAGLGPSDIKFIAADNVFFFAHIAHIASQSSNRFNGLLPTAPGAAMFVPELSPVFNVVLHTVYGWSCSAFSPTLEDVAAALTALAAYGVSLSTCLARNSPLYAVVLTHAARQPMETYALAAAHDVEHLASAVSSQLLSYRLSELLDEHALRMGARYLLRLAKLQQERMEKLRDLVLAPPEGHLPAPSCGFVQQRTLTAVWANVTAEMSWKARPGALQSPSLAYTVIDREPHRRSARERDSGCVQRCGGQAHVCALQRHAQVPR